MNTTRLSLDPLRCALVAALLGAASLASAFDSGSTGADGAFNPVVSTQVPLPANGVLNYTSVNIPLGVVVTFAKNTTNTPVVILASGDVTIAGQIDVSGGNAAAAGASGDGNIGDDGVPGTAGPGGYDGGRGGRKSGVMAENVSGAGQGPGGAGISKAFVNNQVRICGGSGGGFGGAGEAGGTSNFCTGSGNAAAGTAYGQAKLLPLIGGSGGSGGAGYVNYVGAGGGGGGGALLIAVSGTLNVTGEVRAFGGRGGASSGQGAGAAGGGGSGGAIRLVATTINGNGPITATGGANANGNDNFAVGGKGADGRIRLEAETISRNAATTPPYTFDQPGPVFVAGLPTLRVLSVAGVDAPVAPTGTADIALPDNTQNPVSVVVATTGVPLGNTVKLVVTPAHGAPTETVSNALAGAEESATATAQVTLPVGPSTLLATVSYSVPEDGEENKALAKYTDGEPVQRVELSAGVDGATETVLHTRSGRRVVLDRALAARGG